MKKPKLKRSDTVIKTDIESERGKGDIRIESLVTLLLLAQRINNDCLYAHIIKEMSSRYEGYIAFEKQPEACKTQGGRNKYADYEAMVAQFFNETDSKAAFDLLRASHGVAITSGRGADDVDVDDGGCRCSPWLLKAILDERSTTMMNVPCEVFRDNAWHNGVVNKLDHSMGYTRAYVHYTVEMHVDKPRMAYDFVSILPDQIRLH